jgi:hypothetical protein
LNQKIDEMDVNEEDDLDGAA